MRSLFLAILIFSGSAWAGGSVVVGTGGEGVLVDGRLYLRDFYETGRSEMHIGLHHNPEFQFILGINPRRPDLNVSPEILVRKYTDMEEVVPGLGFAAALTLEQYTSFKNEDHPFDLPLNDPLPKGLEGERAVVILRRAESFRIWPTYWSMLDETEKLALLIHEAIYTLQTPECGFSFCTQSPKLTREITSRLFSSQASRDQDLKDLIRKHLALPSACQGSLPGKVGVELKFTSSRDLAKTYYSRSRDFVGAKVAREFCGQISRSMGVLSAKATIGDHALRKDFPGEFQDGVNTEFYTKPILQKSWEIAPGECEPRLEAWLSSVELDIKDDALLGVLAYPVCAP